jgi:ATP-dependent Zn protease
MALRRTIANERRRTAFHEAGHAIVGYLHFGNAGEVTIRPSGDRLGVAVTERMWWTPEIVARMAAGDAATRADGVARAHAAVRHLLAGRAAERLLDGSGRAMAGDDDGVEVIDYIDAAYPKWRSSRNGFDVHIDLVHELVVQTEWRRALLILRRYERQLRRVARLLLAKETITGDEWLEAVGRMRPALAPVLFAEDRVAIRVRRRSKA